MSKAVENEAIETVEVEENIKRPYTLRKMKDRDLIPLLGIFRAIGLKSIKEVLLKAANGEITKEDVIASIKEIGVDVVLDIADTMITSLSGEAGELIYQFYSELSNIPAEEIKDMEFGTMPLMIYDSFSEAKNTSFFKVLAKLL